MTVLCFRKVYAAFALHEAAFFGSPDIQYLRIGTVVRGAILLPPFLPVETQSTPEHNYTIFSISMAPKIGQDFFAAFKSLFTSEDYAVGRGEIGFIFEVKLMSPQYWQVRIRILLNATCKNKLENLILKKHIVLKKRSCLDLIKTPEENDDSWKKILNGVQEKKGLIKKPLFSHCCLLSGWF